jgi:hypothetical protein
VVVVLLLLLLPLAAAFVWRVCLLQAGFCAQTRRKHN